VSSSMVNGGGSDLRRQLQQAADYTGARIGILERDTVPCSETCLGRGHASARAGRRAALRAVGASVCGFAAAGSGKLTRGQARQPAALTRHVCLIGVAGGGGGSSEVVPLAGDELAEAEDTLKDLGAVTNGRHEAAPQVALAEAEIRSHAIYALSRVKQTHDGGLYRGIRRVGNHEPRGCR
jgi:hypothetical protein